MYHSFEDEAKLERQAELAKICELALQLLAEANCSNRDCDGRGCITTMGQGHGCDGTDEVCLVTCPVPVPEQEQCQWCYERNALLEKTEEKTDE